jgi:replication factor C subunit 3/5
MVNADVMEVEVIKPAKEAPLSRDADSSALMWVEKYRPHGLGDLLSHGSIVTTLRRLISNNQLPHLLFYGPPGTGKTSAILACAREMYGNEFRTMVLELNASDSRGIDVVRDQIKSFASTRRIFSSGIKLIILDEADAMTSQAQMALRRVVEKYTANTRFCIICNYVNKILPALQSRCTRFRFGPLPASDIRARVEQIASQEQVKLADGAVDTLLSLAHGDMRRVLNILQSTHMAVSPGIITPDALYANTGDPHPSDVEDLFETLLTRDFAECALKINCLKKEKGIALNDLISGLTNLVTLTPAARMSADAKIYLYQELANSEHRIALGGSDNVNTAALVGAFALGSAISNRPTPV